MSQFDSILFDQNEVNSGKPRRKKKGGLKAKAEFEFDVSAAPVKLDFFFKEMMENGPDEPSSDISESHNSVLAPMITNVPLYNSDCHVYSGEVLNATNDYLSQLEDEDELEEIEKFEDSKVNTEAPQIIEFKSVIKTIDKNIMDEKKEYRNLTAKRMSLKALQMFSFSEHCSKHFTSLPVDELRSLNVDMIIDKSQQSLQFLKRTGSRYFEKYYQMYKIPSIDKIYKMQMDWKCRNNAGYAKILSDITMNDLLYPDREIELKPEFKESIYVGIKLNHILCYFGFKFFDYNSDIYFALQHLNVISMYYPPKRKFFVKNLFDKKKAIPFDEENSYSLDPGKSILNDDSDLSSVTDLMSI